MSEIGDTRGSSSVTDHPFTPPQGETWGRCVFVYLDEDPRNTRRCGLSEAAHAHDPQDPPRVSTHASTERDGNQATESTVTPPISDAQIEERENGGPVFGRTDKKFVEAVLDGALDDPSRDEIIATQGHKDDDGKVSWSTAPWHAMDEMAEVMTFGAKKYDRHNYRKGMEYSRLWDAAIRHLKAWHEGEENDSETGKSHLAHAACCVLMLRDIQILGKGADNRPHTEA